MQLGTLCVISHTIMGLVSMLHVMLVLVSPIPRFVLYHVCEVCCATCFNQQARGAKHCAYLVPGLINMCVLFVSYRRLPGMYWACCMTCAFILCMEAYSCFLLRRRSLRTVNLPRQKTPKRLRLKEYKHLLRQKSLWTINLLRQKTPTSYGLRSINPCCGQ